MSWTFWIFLLTDMGFNSTLVSFIGRIHHSSPFLNFYIAAGRGKSFSPIPNVFFMPAMEHEVGYGILFKMGSLTGSCRKRRACILTFVPLFVKWSQNSHSLPARKPQPSHAHTLPAFTPALTQNRPLTKFPPSSPGDFPQGFQWRHGGLCGFNGTPARL